MAGPLQTKPAADWLPKIFQFFDQPQFAVAGVTDTTNLGGHGSDTVVRTRETLAKAVPENVQLLAHKARGSAQSHGRTRRAAAVAPVAGARYRSAGLAQLADATPNG